MKNIVLVVLFLCSLPCWSEAQSASIRKFYRNHKHDANVTHYYIPGFAIKIASIFIADNKADRRLLRKLGGVRVLVSEDQNNISKEDFRKFIHNVRDDSFEDFIQVKEADQSVNIMVREKDDIIRGVLVTAHEKDEFVLVSAKSKIKTEDLMRLVALRDKLK